MGTEFADLQKRPDQKPQQPRHSPKVNQPKQTSANQQASAPSPLMIEQAKQSEVYQRYVARLASYGEVPQTQPSTPTSSAHSTAPSPSEPDSLMMEQAKQSEVYQRYLARLASYDEVPQTQPSPTISSASHSTAPLASALSEKAPSEALPPNKPTPGPNLLNKVQSKLKAFVAPSPQTSANPADAPLDQSLIAPGNASPAPTTGFPVKPQPIEVASTNLTPGMLAQQSTQGTSDTNAPSTQNSIQSDPKQLIAQAKSESEGAWLNAGIASKGGPERMPFDGRILRTDKNGKQTIIPVKYGQIVQQQAGDQLQYSFGKVPQNQSPSQKQRDEAIKKMPYPDKLSTAMKLVPGMLEGDAKKLFEQLTTDPKFVAALAAGGAAFGALQFTPAGPAIDAAFMVAPLA